MRKLTATICLTIAVLLGVTGCQTTSPISYSKTEVEGSDLPPCPSDQNQRYHNCFGTYTYPNGDTYAGEWKDNKKNGRFTVTRFLAGTVDKNVLYQDDEYQETDEWYIKKGSPTVTGRKSPPSSKSASELENEKLRKRIAELEKQKQSRPKQKYTSRSNVITKITNNSKTTGWTKISESVEGYVYYLDYQRITKNRGYIYYWELWDSPKPIGGYYSFEVYKKLDCKSLKTKRIQRIRFNGRMGKGTFEVFRKPDQNWGYPRPNSSGELIVRRVCDFVDK